MMNTQTLAVALKRLVENRPEQDQRKLLGVAAGFVAGYSMPLFADGSELPPEALFEKHHEKKVRETLAQLNNVTVINLADAIELAGKVWVTRYRLVHEPFSPTAFNAYVGAAGPAAEFLNDDDKAVVSNLAVEFLSLIQEA